MLAPLIGVTTEGRQESGKFALEGPYVDAIRRAQGVPVLIPPLDHAAFAPLLPHLGGVVLAGGSDVGPNNYGGAAHPLVYGVDAERDQAELELCRRVIAAGIPLLGVCRGLQVLNVALGGTLVEHIPDVYGESIAHRVPPCNPTSHQLTIDPTSRLATILNATAIAPVSWHHQSVGRPAAGLRVVAQAADGVIEALEVDDAPDGHLSLRAHPWLYAVQWHPEMSAATDPEQQRLFDVFVAAASTHTVNLRP